MKSVVCFAADFLFYFSNSCLIASDVESVLMSLFSISEDLKNRLRNVTPIRVDFYDSFDLFE